MSCLFCLFLKYKDSVRRFKTLRFLLLLHRLRAEPRHVLARYIIHKSVHFLLSILVVVTTTAQAYSNSGGDALHSLAPHMLVERARDTDITVGGKEGGTRARVRFHLRLEGISA